MSHFVILVIGDNIDEQLAKYDENIQTEPVYQGEVSAEEKARFIDFYHKQHGLRKNANFDKAYAQYGEDWNNNTWKKENGVWCEYTTYNPNSKWDWYIIGGRWSGFMKVKEGVDIVLGQPGVFNNVPREGYVDQCYKRDLDLEGQRQIAVDEANAKYEAVVEAFGGTIPKIEKSWENFMALVSSNVMTIEEARTQYHNQSANKLVIDVRNAEIEALKEIYRLEHAAEIEALVEEKNKLQNELDLVELGLAKLDDDITKAHSDRIKRITRELDNAYDHKKLVISHWFDLNEFQCTQDEFAQKAYNNAFMPFGFVRDGKWYERGEMGWWGIVSNEKDSENWNTEFNKMLDELDDDILLTVVDCHI